MQIDMHYYGTYAISRLAGFNPEDANVIATAAQFVDDATSENSEKNKSGEMLFAIATAHHLINVPIKSLFHRNSHRLVWVPFHFYPGGQGSTLEEKMLCTKNSEVVNEMFDNHLEMKDKVFYLHLLGIASHVYMDTFAHYGFSGICSELNTIENTSIKFENKLEAKIKKYIEDKSLSFAKKNKKEMRVWNKQEMTLWGRIRSIGGSMVGEGFSGNMGHGAVATYPDRPYLSWSFKYEKARHGKGVDSDIRNNQETFMEGLEHLHKKLVVGAKMLYPNPEQRVFDNDVRKRIKKILKFQGEEARRSQKWKDYIKEIDTNNDGSKSYCGEEWNDQKGNFHNIAVLDKVGDCYCFHQAAAYHRWFSLKDLLPAHGIYVV